LIRTAKLAKIDMLDQNPDTKGPKTGKNYPDTKRPNSDLPSKGIIRDPRISPIHTAASRRKSKNFTKTAGEQAKDIL
jgi:hypothetical protein